MLLPGTEMDIVTFIFVSIETVIFCYLIIYKLARPYDATTFLNIILIALLLTYNITGGLLPDPRLPGSKFVQETIAYGTGFITPCFFPYYVFKVFGLKKMKFHVMKGVVLFLFFPYLLFVCVYYLTGSLSEAKNILGLPVLYALWVIYSLVDAIKEKYSGYRNCREANLLLLSIVPWVGLPVVAYFDLSQATEASITNGGFLLLMGLQVSRHVRQLRIEHERLEKTEKRLLDWNSHLQDEVNKRTEELEKIIEQRTNTFVSLAHETKTPLTLIQNCIEEYISKRGTCQELQVIKQSLTTLSADIINLFDIERYNKGIKIYNHEQLCDFTKIAEEQIILFKRYAVRKKIQITSEIECNVCIMADPVAITRLVNNLIENAIKFSFSSGTVGIELKRVNDAISFIVRDNGLGIPAALKEKVFEPYFQIVHDKNSNTGMGMGLPLVKKIVQDLEGTIELQKNVVSSSGTELKVVIPENVNLVSANLQGLQVEEASTIDYSDQKINEAFEEGHPWLLLVEDSLSMSRFLYNKLSKLLNVTTAGNGHEALDLLKVMSPLPDIVVADVIMNQLDGLQLVKILNRKPSFENIPVILISAKAKAKDRLEALRAGAADFIEKPFFVEELSRKIQLILEASAAQKVLLRADKISNKGEKTVLSGKYGDFHLSKRERDIVQLISRGAPYKEIAASLYISVRTVTT
ncbi:MAG: ATP-binding protein, partial [Mucilaginibacter sp.]